MIMQPETKFAFLMVGLLAGFPVAVVAVHVLHRAFVDGLSVRIRPFVVAVPLLFASGAYGQTTDPNFRPLQWTGTTSGALSPSAYCESIGSNMYLVAKVWIGFPTQFVCTNASGTSVATNVLTTYPGCPSGYHVDLQLQLCVLDSVGSSTEEGGGSVSSLKDMTPEDAAMYGSMILFLWACAWSVKAVMDVVRETGNPPDET